MEINLLKENARLTDFHVEQYPASDCMVNEELDRLEPSLPDSLKIMRTWDLGEGVEYYHDRWRTLIS